MPGLEDVFEGELEHTWTVHRAYDLEGSEPWVGDEIAGLVQCLTVAAGRSRWGVLDGIHTIAVLHVVICVVQQVERLHLEQKGMPFRQREAPRNSQINLLRPGPVEGIQSCDRARTAPIDAECRIGGGLQSCGIVHAV